MPHRPSQTFVRCFIAAVLLVPVYAAREVNKERYDVTVVSPRNHFLFTPLLPSTTVGTLEFRYGTALSSSSNLCPDHGYFSAHQNRSRLCVFWTRILTVIELVVHELWRCTGTEVLLVTVPVGGMNSRDVPPPPLCRREETACLICSLP